MNNHEPSDYFVYTDGVYKVYNKRLGRTVMLDEFLAWTDEEREWWPMDIRHDQVRNNNGCSGDDEHDETTEEAKKKQEVLDKDARNFAIHMRSKIIGQAMFMLNQAHHKLQSINQYFNCAVGDDFDRLFHNISYANGFMELAFEQLEDIMDEDWLQRRIQDAHFWKEISKLGIVIYENGPSPVDRNKTQWAVDKHPTAQDGSRWDRSYPTFEDAVEAADKYWHDGEEPKMYEWMF